ncbi:MAG: hypothetical protein IJ561_00485 [Ruminococcus sp.]|nr:hypothetical protein [Ruminococcus sp.]
MLGELLSKEECAKCRLCCSFDSYDLLDTPVITDEVRERITALLPGQRFITKGGCSLLRLDREGEEDVYPCALLDKSKGCLLGDEKPFECRIWPLRIMRLGEVRVIALSTVCPVVAKKPVELISKVCEGIAPELFRQADLCPELVKPYEEGFPILAVEPRPEG